MSPRPYRLGKREEGIDQGRRRILDAARELLRTATSYPEFTVDAVARRADVARATVYYQFGSKTGLLEAVCDDLAEAGGMANLARVFTNSAPDAAIRGFIMAFAGFWAADRIVMRRLRALGALDPDVGVVIAARDQRRREGLTVLVSRLPSSTRTPAEQTVQMFYTLTSFETFDMLAGPERDLADALPMVIRLAEAALLSGDVSADSSSGLSE
jgi:AcrR family transcriptional regulator